MTNNPRRGFTMIELLVVISIIAILSGMLFGVLNMLKRQQKKVATTSLMSQLTVALNDYLGTYPIIGDLPGQYSQSFVDSPWTYLGRNPLLAGKVPYIDLPEKSLARGVPPGPFDKGTQADSDQVLDTYTIADRSNHLVWRIINKQSGGAGAYTYTDQIWLRSAVGTPDQPRDDIIMRLTMANGQWLKMSYGDAIADVTDPPPTMPTSFWSP